MKKIFLISIFFLFTSITFAKPIIQAGYSGLAGVFTSYNHSAFDLIQPVDSYNDFNPEIADLSASFYWEFASKNQQKHHFYTGTEIGLFGIGISLSCAGGFSYKLGNIGPVLLQLNSTINAGISVPILTISNAIYGFSKASIDLIAINPTQKGLYAGIGITECLSSYINYYITYGFDYHLINFAGLHFVTGIKL